MIFWIDSIPQSNSIIPNICSRAILTGQFPDYNKLCSLASGEYTNVHNTRTITITMAALTSPAIAMGPMSNLQCGHRFFCLHSKCIITPQQWTKLPLPDTIIHQLLDISMKERKWTNKSKQSHQSDTDTEYSISHRLEFDLLVTISMPPQFTHPDPVDQKDTTSIPTVTPIVPTSPSKDDDNHDRNNHHEDSDHNSVDP